MLVFKAEREDGLEEKIRSNTSVAYASAVQLLSQPLEEVTLPKRALAKVRNRVKAAAGQPDLHYMKTLLVTAGVINKNDDAFDIVETWSARHSPEDKPFNYEHQGDDIIGHITGCYVIDDEQQVVEDDTIPDDLPEKFHIVTSAVLYKFWEDDELQERMDTILVEIAEGKWFVSMEALFKGFDYLLMENAGSASKVVARNKDTAFLTKHLKAYGGDGNYEKYRVCRLLKNITFSGKGLVRKPANPESIIFDQAETFAAIGEKNITLANQLGYSSSMQRITQESKTMAVDNTDALTIENKNLKTQIETLQASLKEHDKAQLGVLTGEINSLKSKLEASEQKSKVAEDDSKNWKQKFEELQASAEATAKELQTIKVNQARAARVSLLVKKLDMDETKASEMADKLTYLKDDEFTAHADYLSEKLAAFKQTSGGGGGQQSGGVGSGPQTSAKPVPKQTDKPAPMGGFPKKVKTLAKETDAGAVHADVDVLEDVEVSKEPALATQQTDNGVEKVRASIVEYMADYFKLPADDQDDEK